MRRTSRTLGALVLFSVTMTACSGGNSVLTPAPTPTPVSVATASPTPGSVASTTPSVTPSAIASATPSAKATASPTPAASATPTAAPSATPTIAATASPTAVATANVIADGGFEAEGTAMTLSSWTKCSYAHPTVNSSAAAATPAPAITASAINAELINSSSASFTVGAYPGAGGTPTPFATVAPAVHGGNYATLVFTGTGAGAATFGGNPNPGPDATPYPAGANGICQSFAVPTNGVITAYVNEGGYESNSATRIYGYQEGAIFAGGVAAVGTELPTTYIFQELNTQETTGYVPSYVQKTYTFPAAMYGQTVTLYFGTYDSGPSQKYGEYMFVDDVSVTGIPATLSRTRAARFGSR